MKKLKKTLALLLAVAMVLSLTACGSSDSAESSAVSTASNAEASVQAQDASADESAATGTPASTDLVVGWTTPVEGLDPASSNNGIGMRLVYETLFSLDENNEPQPFLAESYEMSEDGLTLDIKLRDDVTFSNGAALTGEDVLFSLKYYVDAGSNLSTYFADYDWDNCTADGLNVTLKFTQKNNNVLYYLTGSTGKIQCKAYYEENGDEAFWDSPCGTGPYALTENVSGAYSKYQLRDDYWGEKPVVTSYTVNTYAEETTMEVDLENGTLDMAFDLSSTFVDTYNADPDAYAFTLTTQSSLDVPMLVLSDYVEYWHDENVRKAIAYGVDWDAVAAAGYGSLSKPATSTLPDNVQGKIDVGTYEYDPDKAKEYMAQSDYADGFSVSLVIVNSTANNDKATSLQYYLSELGIDLDIQAYDIGTAIPMFMSGETDMLLKETSGGAFLFLADQIYDTMKSTSTNVAAAIMDPTFDGYLMGGLYEDADQAETCYENAQQWLYDSCWAMPICEPLKAYACKDGISLTTPSVDYPDLTNTTFE